MHTRCSLSIRHAAALPGAQYANKCCQTATRWQAVVTANVGTVEPKLSPADSVQCLTWSYLGIRLPNILDDCSPAGIIDCQMVRHGQAGLGSSKDAASLLRGDVACLQQGQPHTCDSQTVDRLAVPTRRNKFCASTAHCSAGGLQPSAAKPADSSATHSICWPSHGTR